MKIKSIFILVIASVFICLLSCSIKSYSLGITDNFNFFLDTSLQKYQVKIDGLKFNGYFDNYVRCTDRWTHIISSPTIISGMEKALYSCYPIDKLSLINNSSYMIDSYFNIYADGQILKIEYLFPYNPWKNYIYNNTIILYLDSFGKLSQRAV